jgi:biopolymer transport protein TolR
MALSSRRKRRRFMAEINVVPYIDVMLVLLVIFMITAPLLTQGVNVNLPKASAKVLPPKAQMPMIISVNRGGQYYLNVAKNPGKSLSAQQLMSTVNDKLTAAQQNNQKLDVYVKGDKDVAYGTVVQAMVLLQKAGADNVGLITDDIKTTS